MISVGIDIGAFSVKVAEVESSSKGFQIHQFQSIPLSTDPSKDHDIEILDILRQIQNRYSQANVRYVAALPDSSVTFRRLFFPFKERHKILKSLPFELEDDIPFDQDECVFDARVSQYIDNQSDVLACACPHEKIEKLLQVFKDAQLEPDIVSVESIALSNLFEVWREGPLERSNEDNPPPAISQVDLVLDLGHESTKLILLKDGYTLTTHQIDWGGKNLAEAISVKYSIHYVEAVKELQKKSFVLVNDEGSTDDQVTFSNVMKENLDELCHKLNLILMDLKAEYQLDYKSLILMGGTSQVKNLGPYLTQQLAIPCNRLKKLSLIPQMDFKTNKNQELECATALGLAFEGLKKPKNPALNLLRDEFAKEGQHLKMLWEKWSYTIKVATAVYVVLVTYGVLKSQFSDTLASKGSTVLRTTAKKVAGLSGTKASPVAIKKFIRKKQKQERDRELLQDLQNINSALDILQLVSLNSPKKSENEKINVSHFSVTNKKIKMEGYADSRTTLNKLKKSLEGLAIGGKVKSDNQIKAPRFAFTWDMKRKSGVQ